MHAFQSGHVPVRYNNLTTSVSWLDQQLQHRTDNGFDRTCFGADAFAADVTATAGDDRAPWSQFLYGDPAASSGPYNVFDLSHYAAGPAHVAMRSSWDKSAVWGAFSGGAYINAADSERAGSSSSK